MKVIYSPFQSSAPVLFVSRLSLLYCLDVPYSLVVTGRVRVEHSAMLCVSLPCVFCPLSHMVVIVRSNTYALQSLIMSLDKKLLLILHVY